MSQKKKPVSDKQLAANRANAAKSTGPRTPEGKSRSAQNSRAHGFCASSFTVVRLEDFHELNNLRADAVDFYQPQNSQELFTVERIALAQLSILRLARLEAGLFNSCMNEVMEDNGAVIYAFKETIFNDVETTKNQNRNFLLAEGFQRFNRRSEGGFPLLLRYQAQAERLYRRAIEEFERLQKQRGAASPSEPILDAQPLEEKTVIRAARKPGEPRTDPYEPSLEPPAAPIANSGPHSAASGPRHPAPIEAPEAVK